jgi:hypothetical protein
MALDTDFSRKPYFDDYDITKNFYRVLYRPAAAVQARELNQMQTILQDQIDKFGRHIFKEGSVVEGCGFTFDSAYNYVKIKDNYANNSAISNVSDFIGKIAINSNGLQASIVNALGGYESSDPDLNTLYIKYLNSSTYANGTQQSIFSNSEVIQIQTSANVNIGNVVVATVTNSTGKGYAPDANGLIYVSFYGPQPANPNYQVISTDYETFAIVYGCEPGYPKPNLWYLSRTPTISNALLAQMQATAESALPNFDFSTLVPDIQGSQCTYAAATQDGFLQ